MPVLAPVMRMVVIVVIVDVLGVEKMKVTVVGG